MLDHILLSRSMASSGLQLPPLFDYDVVHLNAEFDDQVSDHDPQVAQIRP